MWKWKKVTMKLYCKFIDEKVEYDLNRVAAKTFLSNEEDKYEHFTSLPTHHVKKHLKSKDSYLRARQ